MTVIEGVCIGFLASFPLIKQPIHFCLINEKNKSFALFQKKWENDILTPLHFSIVVRFPK
jgi:hypothetical protein